MAQSLSLDGDATALSRVIANQSPTHLLLARAAQTDKRQNFSRVQGKIDRTNIADIKPLTLQQGRMARCRWAHKDAFGPTTDNGSDKAFGIGFRGEALIDQLAVPQNNKAIRDRKNLVQAMRHIHHAHATRF